MTGFSQTINKNINFNIMKKENLIIASFISLVVVSIPFSFWAGNIAPTFFTMLTGAYIVSALIETSN